MQNSFAIIMSNATGCLTLDGVEMVSNPCILEKILYTPPCSECDKRWHDILKQANILNHEIAKGLSPARLLSTYHKHLG